MLSTKPEEIMAEKEVNKLQEVIQLAVDAADVATDASFEFKRIKDANSKMMVSVERIYKHGFYVFLASSAVLALSVLLIGLLSFTKLGNVENMVAVNKTAVATFAQNVVDLKSTMEKIEDGLRKNEKIVSAVAESGTIVKAAEVTVESMEKRVALSLEAIATEVGQMKSALSQMEGQVGKSIDGSSTSIARRVISQLGSKVAQQTTLSNISSGQIAMSDQIDARLATLERMIIDIANQIDQDAKQVKYP
tara:strand:- start:16 stop:762 length:747 start_codon:yes stop_codon:yes gene_type:complete